MGVPCYKCLGIILTLLNLIESLLTRWTNSQTFSNGQWTRSDHKSLTCLVSENQQRIPILYEDERILVVNKPAGMCHHNTAEEVQDKSEEDASSPSNQNEPGLVTRIRQLQANGTFLYQGRLYGVQRLDRVTSGIVVFAKSSHVAGILSKAFREHKITKYYVALSAKKATKRKQGLIVGDMIRSRRGSWQLTRTRENPAVTRFFTCGLGHINDRFYPTKTMEKLHEGEGDGSNEGFLPKTLLLLKPITGRTHQLRVGKRFNFFETKLTWMLFFLNPNIHLRWNNRLHFSSVICAASKSVGLPILGDRHYGGGTPNANRTYLHASVLHMDMDDIGIENTDPVTVISYPPFDDLWRGDFCPSETFGVKH